MTKKSRKTSIDKKWIIGAVAIPLIIAIISLVPSLMQKSESGVLKVSDLQIHADVEENVYILDFRVTNTGNTKLSVEKVSFELFDIITLTIGGFLDYSHTYDFDISTLKKIGDVTEISLSQEIAPKEVDRFGIRIIASDLPVGIERGWKVLPTVYSNFNSVVCDTARIWFPCDKSHEFTEKYWQQNKVWEQEYLRSIQDR